jgi:hypothetical protein
MKDEVKFLQNKAIQWSEKVRVGFLNNVETWTCLNTTVMKTIEYGLPATTMTKKDLDSIISPIINVGLSRSGICRKLARKIVFVPNKYQGLGARHPYETQGINKTEILFQPDWKMTTNLVETSWVQTMAECGMGADFLLEDASNVSDILTDGWVVSLWKFLTSNSISVERIDTTYHRSKRNWTDEYIMKDVCKTKQFTKEELRTFNYCRMFLKVELVTDIMTADGKGFRRHIWQAIKDYCHEDFSKSYYEQPKPGESAWVIWRRLLRLTYKCNEYGKFQTTREPVSRSDVEWQWYYQPELDRIYRKI